jgi:hypothetical protein
MTTKERKKIEPIIESTRWKLKEAGYIGALVVGKDATELRECIKNTFVGLLADADLDEVKSALQHIIDLDFIRDKSKPKPQPEQLYLF